jgi:hypothetical protein
LQLTAVNSAYRLPAADVELDPVNCWKAISRRSGDGGGFCEKASGGSSTLHVSARSLDFCSDIIAAIGLLRDPHGRTPSMLKTEGGQRVAHQWSS